ncbi:LysR family transcriptional regulator [Granulosicoccaceae sp. 1_MG-2023]|nr:LysR family transcriptional regulator [Granulosicoccaceae sp. 1_MG-2023]
MHPKTTLEQWRALQAVVDHGGYVAAAQHLGRSHSAVNHAVQRLQQQLGVSLLTVQGRKAVLTPIGEVLLRESRQLSRQAQSLESLAETLSAGWETHVTLSVDELYPADQLANVLKAFLPESRGCRIRIRNDVLGGSHEAIRQRNADLVIFGSDQPVNDAEPIGQTSFIPVAHPSHPLFDGAVTFAGLARHTQIAIADTAVADQDKQDNAWLLTEQRITVSSISAALELLTRGIGYCFVPQHRVRDQLLSGALRELPVSHFQSHQVGLQMIMPKGPATGPAIRHLAELFRREQSQA